MAPGSSDSTLSDRTTTYPESMDLGLWLLGFPLGLALLFVVFRMAGLTDATPRGQRPRWLLVFSGLMFAIGMIMLVVAARSGR
jgi:drug/metabolite transporter (DMT)-like permease